MSVLSGLMFRGVFKTLLDKCIGLKSTVEARVTDPERRLFGEAAEARSNQASAATFSCIPGTPIVKTATSYFVCFIPEITSAILSSIWTQPSI
jgi:hypothetical protein